MIPPRLGVWPTLPLRTYASAPSRLPFPLDRPDVRLYARARHGLFHALRLLLEPGDEVLVPAWHHGSEVEAIRRAGAVPRFYGVTDRLEPDETSLEQLLGPRVRALHLVHFLGTPQDAPRWRRFCDEHGLLLVEDAAMAWLAETAGEPVGSWGDVAIFCLYKTFGVPDGAATLAPAVALPPPSRLASGVTPLLRRHGSRELGRFDAIEELVRRHHAARPTSADADIAVGEPLSAPSRVTLPLLERAYDAGTADRRRQNHRELCRLLGDAVSEPFRTIPDGAAPFALALETADKPALLARLDAALITPLDIWSRPHPSTPRGFAREEALRERLVAVPVHQDLTERDVERIAMAARPRRTQPSLVLEPVESFAAEREAWSALAAASGNVFATPEWHETWWRHYGSGKELQLTAARDRSGRVVAILPLYLWRERPRVLRFTGHALADLLGPVCAPEDRGPVGAALRRALDDRRWRWDVLVAEQLRADEAWAPRLGGRVARRTGFPILPLGEGGWEAFLAGRSGNFRQDVRRRQRRAAQAHEVVYRLATAETLAADLETLFRLHDRRWAGDRSAFTASGRTAFHHDFAAVAAERGWVRLWILELDGEPAAAWYGFRYEGSDGYYQAGREPAFDRLAPGTLLLLHSIRDAADSGMREYRFLRGDEPYKYRFATVDPGLEIVVRGRGRLAAAALALGAAGLEDERIRPLLRRTLGG